jgi:hypothetical protein
MILSAISFSIDLNIRKESRLDVDLLFEEAYGECLHTGCRWGYIHHDR